MEKSDLLIYTDGSCSPNPGPGGWAAVLLWPDGRVIELRGAERQSTNNRMELTAALQALQYLEKPTAVEVVTDSRYLQQGIGAWLQGWKRNGWKTAGGQAVRNRDLWEQLGQSLDRHRVSWRWVKGHGADAWNGRADELAVEARKSIPRPSPQVAGVQLHVGVTWKSGSGAGAWSAILQYGAHLRVLGGRCTGATANRLYLLAAIEGLGALKRPLPVVLHTRSGYLRDGLGRWLPMWRQRGWRTMEGEEIGNSREWQQLDRLRERFAVTAVAVDPDNPPCHLLAAKEIARELEELLSP